jgi:hypothetical protein
MALAALSGQQVLGESGTAVKDSQYRSSQSLLKDVPVSVFEGVLFRE